MLIALYLHVENVLMLFRIATVSENSFCISWHPNLSGLRYVYFSRCLFALQGVICAIMAFFHVPMQRYNVGAQLMSIKPEFSTAGLQYAIDNQQVIKIDHFTKHR